MAKETKTNTKTKTVETKKAPTKAAATKTVKAAKVEDTKVVKAATKPATTKAKVEAPKKEAKAPAKKATTTKAKEAPKATAKAAPKATAKATTKAEPKATVKKETKAAPKAKATTTKKAPAKKAATKTTKVDVKKYADMDIDACMNIANEAGVNASYEDYSNLLLNEADNKKIVKQLVADYNVADKKDFDVNVLYALLDKVAETMDLTAAEFKDIKKGMDAAVKVKLTSDADENNKNYYEMFKTAEKVLMVGQRRNLTTCAEATKVLKSDVEKFFKQVKATAYAVLRNWKYEDVEFYQEFIFAFISQYGDLFDAYQNDAQMDCADLFILHGDEGRGDYEYNYVLRENEIKDYIYTRFATVYVERNLEKAKSIAYSAFQYVDERFEYHKNLVEITQK